MAKDVIIDLVPVYSKFEKELNSEENSPLGICTNCCHWLQKHFPNSKIKGYYSDENQLAKIGEAECGHDFLVINDEFIIDFWYKSTYDENFPLYLPITEAHKFYGQSEKWNDVPNKK